MNKTQESSVAGDGQLCAGGEDGDSCAGDSGSALMNEVITKMREFDPRVVQIGVVSFGPRRCATKVSIHLRYWWPLNL